MPPQLHSPELELRHSAASWVPHAATATEVETSIDILELQGSGNFTSLNDAGVTYKTGLGHKDLVAQLRASQVLGGGRLFRILFVNGHLSRPRAQADFEDIRSSISNETSEFLQEHLNVSPLFLATVLRKSWVLKSGSCHWVKDSDCGSGKEIVEGWYRYSCGLKSFPSYVWYSYSGACTTYIITSCEYNGVQEAIVQCVSAGMGGLLLRPLAVDGFIAEASSEGWGEEILTPRKALIHYEHVDDRGIDTRETVKDLHVLSYNFLIIKEDLTDHIERLEYLLDVYKALEQVFGAAPVKGGVNVQYSLSLLLSETRMRKRWVDCYANRTSIQINLWYNLSSQKDNKTNLKIADYTSKIAVETQKDSSSMITMAAVTMAFLPGTFVSALFSMVFFETNTLPNGRTSLSLGANWWLFPAITVPLTILVFAIWHIWRTRRNAKQIEEFNRVSGLYASPNEKSVTTGVFFGPPSLSFQPTGFTTPDGFKKEPIVRPSRWSALSVAQSAHTLDSSFPRKDTTTHAAPASPRWDSLKTGRGSMADESDSRARVGTPLSPIRDLPPAIVEPAIAVEPHKPQPLEDEPVSLESTIVEDPGLNLAAYGGHRHGTSLLLGAPQAVQTFQLAKPLNAPDWSTSAPSPPFTSRFLRTPSFMATSSSSQGYPYRVSPPLPPYPITSPIRGGNGHPATALDQYTMARQYISNFQSPVTADEHFAQKPATTSRQSPLTMDELTELRRMGAS